MDLEEVQNLRFQMKENEKEWDSLRYSKSKLEIQLETEKERTKFLEQRTLELVERLTHI